MCLLTVMQPYAVPTAEQLYTAAESNPHGFGYAFLLKDTIITGRGMDAQEVIERFLRLREGFVDCYAMFHTRYTTHGASNKANCHPFRVGGSKDTVLAHNGVLPLDPADGRSDTRFFAEDWLPELGLDALDDEQTYEWLEKWAAGSKVAIFTLDPALKNNVYILNEHLGHWKDGIWWSNYSYEPYPTYGSALGYTPRTFTDWFNSEDDSFLEDECGYCRAIGTADPKYNYCRNCYSCFDCYEDINSCLCYNPAKKQEDIIAEIDKDSLLPYSPMALWNFDK